MKKILPVLLILMMLLQTVACSKKPADTRAADIEARKAENAQLTTESTGKGASSTSLPGYTPTGNPDVDAVNYSKAKEDLYNNHPEQYQQWAESMQNAYNQQNPGAATPVATQPPASTPQIIEIPYEEYIQMPQEKRDHIDAHPELYKVVK